MEQKLKPKDFTKRNKYFQYSLVFEEFVLIERLPFLEIGSSFPIILMSLDAFLSIGKLFPNGE